MAKGTSASKKNKKTTKKPEVSQKLGKTEMIKLIAERVSMTQTDVREVIEAQSAIIVEGLDAGRSVSIQDLGTFNVQNLKERSATRDGSQVVIPAARKINFRASSTLRGALNPDDAGEE